MFDLTNRSVSVRRPFSLAAAPLVGVVLLAAAGCASSGGSASDQAPRAQHHDRQSGQHDSMAAAAVDVPASDGGLWESEPIAASAAVLRVNGMSCPKCANNIDKQLTEVGGVERTHIDMGAGEVLVTFGGKGGHPSRADLARAIENSGFTLVSIREAEAGVLR